MTSRIQSYLAGKAYSYHLNAEADAKDAQALMRQQKKSKTSKRINLIKKNKLNSTLAAYSLYYHNGYTDHVYARAIAKLAGFSLPKSNHYPNRKLMFSDFFEPWIEVFFRYPKYLDKCIHQYHIKPKMFLKKDIIQTTIQMQHINITTNKDTIKALSNDLNHWKVKQIKKASKNVSHPKTFINSAISTQHSAIFWDKQFIRLLNLKFKLVQS